MSERPTEVTINGGPGCIFLIAAIIIGIAVGNIWTAPYGWLCVGGILLIWGILGWRHAS